MKRTANAPASYETLSIPCWAETTTPDIPRPRAQDGVEAAKALVMLDLAVFKAELETGMFKKPIEELAKEIHYEPLPGEVRAVITAAWQRGGLLPKAAIEQMVPTAQPTT
jgi:hypothetical protein